MTLPEPDDVQRLLDEALALPTLRPARARLERLAADYRRSQPEEAAAIAVALVGATGAGKSTLLNALAGQRLAIEGEVRPTSREPVIYAPADAELGPLGRLTATVARYVPLPSRAVDRAGADRHART